MPLTTTQKNDRLFKLAATKLALFPGAFDRFMLYVAAGLKVRDTFEVHQALNQKIADFITADGQWRTPEAAEVVAFDRWARELIDEWFHENVNPFPPANDVPYQPVRTTPPYPSITRAAAAQPAPAKERRILRKRDLVQELSGSWPAIEKDLNEAKRGLAKDARRGRGLYDLDAAIQWAKENGRWKDRSESSNVAPLVQAWKGGVARHHMDG